jgi:hypothetical protein
VAGVPVGDAVRQSLRTRLIINSKGSALNVSCILPCPSAIIPLVHDCATPVCVLMHVELKLV